MHVDRSRPAAVRLHFGKGSGIRRVSAGKLRPRGRPMRINLFMGGGDLRRAANKIEFPLFVLFDSAEALFRRTHGPSIC